MIEEAEYVVRITLTTTVAFSPIERKGPITQADAVDNAYGFVSEDVWTMLEGEGFSVSAEAERIG
jgi:hypothetical protein